LRRGAFQEPFRRDRRLSSRLLSTWSTEGAIGDLRKRRVVKTQSVIPLDADETLFETSSREVWQSTLISADGVEVGPVIRQVIEPRMYTIRYLVVYDRSEERRVGKGCRLP